MRPTAAPATPDLLANRTTAVLGSRHNTCPCTAFWRWLQKPRRALSRPKSGVQAAALGSTLSAGLGATKFQLVDDDGRVINAESRDYFLLAGELKLDGKKTEPEHGDVIEELVNGEVTMTQEVMPVDNNQYSATSTSSASKCGCIHSAKDSPCPQ